MKTFFWGYFSKPWKRLLRTTSVLLILLLSIYPFWGNYDINLGYLLYLLIIIFLPIPILSYIVEPFVLVNSNTTEETVNKNQVNSKLKSTESPFLEISRNYKMRKLGLIVISIVTFMILFLTCLYFWMKELDSLGWELYKHPLPFQYILFSLLSSFGITKFISSKVWKRPIIKDTI